jgi:hypothetical protein
LFQRTARRFDGPAATSFCYDPYGLHRSVVPRSRPHLLLAFRFGTFLNEQVHCMRLSRDGLLRQVLSPLVRAGRFVDRQVRGARARRHEQIKQILRRIPADPRRQYVFRYMVQALSDEL